MMNRTADLVIMRTILVCCLILASLPLGAEDASGPLAPFVSKLKAAAQDASIVLSWESPKGIKGNVIIYRSTEVITDAALEKAQVITRIELTRESFIDNPPDSTEYFYAVFVEDVNKTVHKVIIPFRNTTQNGERISLGKSVTGAVGANISGIRASASQDSIVVTFESSDSTRDVMVFRNTVPILTPDDLITSVTPSTIPSVSKQYRDFPIPGIEYYYAILDAERFKLGDFRLIASQNAMTTPVMIPVSAARSGLPDLEYADLLPLPSLSLSSGIASGESLLSSPYPLLPQAKQLSELTKKKLARFLKNGEPGKKSEMKISMLPAEKAGNQSGEAYDLQAIVEDNLSIKTIDRAIVKLSEFLKIEHGEDVTSRAWYYYGQCLYFKNDYRGALVSFLHADSGYYIEIQPWLDACFEKLISSSRTQQR